MSTRLALIASAAILAACSTVPNNPNYEYSSKYGQAGTGAVQTAQVQTQTVQTQTVQADVYSAPTTTVEARHPHDSVVPYYETAPASSPTEQSYDANGMTGTPGYEMMQAQTAPAQAQPAQPQYQPQYQSQPQTQYQASQPVPLYAQPQTALAAPGAPREVTYDYAQNAIVGETGRPAPAAAPTYAAPAPSTAANIAVGGTYVVQPGDTVYNISRRLCVPIPEITSANAIGGDYKIGIGQALVLPNSRC